MANDLMSRLHKCKDCGAMYIVNFEGDDTTCDHCLAENDLFYPDEGNELPEIQEKEE